MGRSRTWCLLVFLCGCSARVPIGQDGPDATAPRPDADTGGQGGHSGAGGATSGTGGGGTGGSFTTDAAGTGTGGSVITGAGGTGTGGSVITGAGGTGTGGSIITGAGGTGTGGSIITGAGGTGTGGSVITGAGGTGTGGTGTGTGGSGTGGSGTSTDGGCISDPGAPLCLVPGAWAPAPAACGAALCGNGTIDVCSSCGTPGLETCDGMALGGETCQRLGYGGGTLKCSRSCGWDASECTRCAPTDDIVRSCINAPLDATVPTAIAMDANDQEIALAWTSLDATGTLGLHFARFAPDLTLISERGLLGPSCPGEIALAARPGGWSLAVNSPGSLRLLALDATGATTSDILVASLSPLSAANSRTVLVHRDGEGPLLAWADAARAPSPFYGVVTRVSSDGASVGMPQDLAFEHPIVELTAAPTLAGWLVSAEQLIGGSEPNQIESFEIGPDGSPLPDAPIAGGWYSGKPRLAAEGTDLRRSCSSLGARNQPPAGIHFGKVVHQGVVTGPLVFVGPAGHYDYAAPMVIINGTTSLFTAYSESTYPRSLQYMQYDAQGTLLVGPRIIATDIDAIKTYVTARRGPDAVVAWINGQPPMLGAPGIGPSSIGMARVTPPQADAGRP